MTFYFQYIYFFLTTSTYTLLISIYYTTYRLCYCPLTISMCMFFWCFWICCLIFYYCSDKVCSNSVLCSCGNSCSSYCICCNDSISIYRNNSGVTTFPSNCTIYSKFRIQSYTKFLCLSF